MTTSRLYASKKFMGALLLMPFWLRQLASGMAALIFRSVSGSIRIRNFIFSSGIQKSLHFVKLGTTFFTR